MAPFTVMLYCQGCFSRTYCLRSPLRYCRVSERASSFFVYLGYTPWKTTSPPFAPALGPRSMRQSAALIISGSCSTTTTVLPMSLRRLSTAISLSVSLGCRPMDGSSRIYMEPTSELPSAVTRLTLWLSPPDSVFIARDSVRYPSPTSSMHLSLYTISSIAFPAISFSVSVRVTSRKNAISSSTVILSNSCIVLPPTFTQRASLRSLLPPHSPHTVLPL